MNLFLLLFLGALWGSSYLFIKITVAEVPALTLVAGRLVLATLFLWAILRWRGLSMPRNRQMWTVYGVLGLLSGALPYSLISWGEQYIPSGLAALLQSSTPIFTVLLAHFLTEDERISRIKLLGIAMGFAGVFLLLLPDLRRGLQANLWGQLAIVGSSVCYAGSAIYGRRHLRGQPALVSSTGQITMGAVFSLPVSLLVDRPFDLSPSLPVLGSWLGLTILGTVVAYILYFILLERTSATFVTTVTYIIPVSGLLLGALVLHEPFDPLLFGTLALILLGVLLVRR